MSFVNIENQDRSVIRSVIRSVLRSVLAAHEGRLVMGALLLLVGWLALCAWCVVLLGGLAVPLAARAGAARADRDQGRILLIRVPQLPSEPRVPPQLPKGAAVYSANVQVCPTYSDASR
jgi:hypothetical protein